MHIKYLFSAISFMLTLSLFSGIYSGYDFKLPIVNAEELTIKGDANGDGKLRASDAAFIAKILAESSISGKKITTENYPNADFNEDEKITASDAAAIAKYLANKSLEKCEIKFRFADKSEGISLRLGNENYFSNLSQQDLNFRLQKSDAKLDEYKEFSKAQILDFTDEQKKIISDTITLIQKQINNNGYKLPLNEELIFINTTAKDELGAYGYTQKNQIYLSNAIVSVNYSELLKKIITHEIFHCLTRSNPQFRKDMYKIIGFSIADEEPEFPQDIRKFIISNPDVEKYDAYATFTINGNKRDCYMLWYITKPFEKEGNDLFGCSSTVLIPIDDFSTIYTIDDASDFWEVIGKNTEYVTAAEECLADNFSFAILGNNGMNYKSPEIIADIIEYIK